MRFKKILKAGVTAVILIIVFAFTREIFPDSETKSLSPISTATNRTVGSSYESEDLESIYDRFRQLTKVSDGGQELARLSDWERNFPFKPTTDPNVSIQQAHLNARNSGVIHPVFANHGYLRVFFTNEARLTPQFKQLYKVLERHNRAQNPVTLGGIFQNTWQYHQAMKHDPEEIMMHQPNPWTVPKPVINLETEEPITWGDEIQSLKDSILYKLAARRRWPDREALSESEGLQALDEILTEVTGMESLTDPGFAYSTDYENELKLGDTPLVPYVGWQAAYDKWESEMKQLRLSSQPRLNSIGEENQLLDQTGNPIIANGNQKLEAILVTPEGQQVPLNQGANGAFVIPTPQEIEELNSLMQ